MKTKRYTESQIFQILKEAETGIPVAELCRSHCRKARQHWGFYDRMGWIRDITI